MPDVELSKLGIQIGQIISNTGNKTMTTINQNVTGSMIHGSVVAAEKIENSFNTQQQSSEREEQLTELINQLQTLINTSPLSETAKQKALTKTQDIAEATQQPEEEQQNIVQKTLGYFDGLADSLESGTETAIKFGETVAGIASLFGL
jgi:hypothetical protein